MIEWLKNIFKKKKPTGNLSLLAKLYYLKEKNIHPYKGNLVDLAIKSIDKYNKDTVEEMVRINSFNLEDKYIYVKPITENRLVSNTIGRWFSNEGRMYIDIHKVVNNWIDVAIEFENTCIKCEERLNTGNYSVNYNKLSPYRIELTRIVNQLIDNID